MRQGAPPYGGASPPSRTYSGVNMKVQIEDISPIKKKLRFEVPEADYKQALEAAYEKLKKKVQIKGFRKGKVPRELLERYYGAKTSMETVSDLVDKSYREAIEKNAILAVGMPNISDLKVEDNSPVKFSAEVEVQPKIETKHFDKIKLESKKPPITDQEIETEMKALQKAHAQWVPEAEWAPAATGHTVTINFAGTLEGVPFEGGKGENVQVPLGQNRFLPDFEKGMIGMKKGESKEYPVKFPEDYGAKNLAGKTAQFHVEILEIKREELPKLDDEFAKDLGKYDTLAKVKDEIRERMLKAKETENRGELFKQVLEHLIKKNSFELPEAMVERELDYLWRTVLQQLHQQRLTPEQVGISEQDYRAKNREEAVRRIKGFLLFDSIAKQNHLEVQESEIDEKLTEIAKGYQQPMEAIKKFYREQNLIRPLYNQLLEQKTLDFILTKAKISEK
jgi:trigger factor